MKKTLFHSPLRRSKQLSGKNRNPECSTAAPVTSCNSIPAHLRVLQGQLQCPPVVCAQSTHTPHTVMPVDNVELPSIAGQIPNGEGSSVWNSTTENPPNAPVTKPAKRKGPPLDAGMPNEAARKRQTHQKCGRGGCSGSNSHRYYQNPCQDCGRRDCPGRDSQHPCMEGSMFHHEPLKP